MSRAIICDFDNLLLKQKFSNDIWILNAETVIYYQTCVSIANFILL
jgi:hypothetical protein